VTIRVSGNSNTVRKRLNEPLYFEDLQPGDCWTSDAREITADDVADFAHLTGDHDKLHTDQLSGAGSPFGEPVAHGLLGLSVLAGLSSQRPCVSTLALIGISAWRFEAPIFFGDVVHVVTTVMETAAHGRRAGRVTWLRQLVNQNNRVVQRGEFVTLVATRSRVQRFSDRIGQSNANPGVVAHPSESTDTIRLMPK
jgi:3-hydroxybutyryl-CoA dehydratase